MNDENLKQYEVRTASEAREKGAKGGKASGVARRKKKQTADLIKLIWGMQPQTSPQTLAALESMGYDADVNGVPTLELLALLSVAKNAASGDLSAIKFLYDYGLIPDMRAQLERERIAASAKQQPENPDRPVIIDERPAVTE